MDVDDTGWQAALDRARPLAALTIIAGDRKSWEMVAVRGLIAVAILGVARRTGTGPHEVPLSVVRVGLDDPQRLTALAGHALAGATPAAVARYDGSATEMWAWLHRRWSPDADGRFDGMPRGIAPGLPDPALDVCLSWAASAVAVAIETDRGALPRRTPVTVTGGELTGRSGVVEAGAWRLSGDDLRPGPPEAYMITTRDGGPLRQERVAATDLTVIAQPTGTRRPTAGKGESQSGCACP